MELKIDRGILSSSSCSIPEKWIGRWQFLSDYCEIHSISQSEEIQPEVIWKYTDIKEIKLWCDLNDIMGSTEREHNRLPVRLIRDGVKKLLVPMDVDAPMEKYNKPHILQSSVDKTLQFMNSYNDEYLLHTVIDSKIPQDRRRVLYHQLGKVIISTCSQATTSNFAIESLRQAVSSLYYPTDIVDSDDVLAAVRDVLDKTPIFCFLGILRTARHSHIGKYDEFYSINWNDMRDMVLTATLPDYSLLQSIECTTDRHKQLVRHTIYFCKHNIKRGIQRMNSLRLMARLPLCYSSRRDAFDTISALSHREAYDVPSVLTSEDVGERLLLKAIDDQLDICDPDVLVSIATNYLGLDAFFRGRMRDEIPIVCTIAQRVRQIRHFCIVRERKRVDMVHIIAHQVGMNYLKVLTKCLRLIIRYRRPEEVAMVVRGVDIDIHAITELIIQCTIVQSLHKSMR